MHSAVKQYCCFGWNFIRPWLTAKWKTIMRSFAMNFDNCSQMLCTWSFQYQCSLRSQCLSDCSYLEHLECILSKYLECILCKYCSSYKSFSPPSPTFFLPPLCSQAAESKGCLCTASGVASLQPYSLTVSTTTIQTIQHYHHPPEPGDTGK